MTHGAHPFGGGEPPVLKAETTFKEWIVCVRYRTMDYDRKAGPTGLRKFCDSRYHTGHSWEGTSMKAYKILHSYEPLMVRAPLVWVSS